MADPDFFSLLTALYEASFGAFLSLLLLSAVFVISTVVIIIDFFKQQGSKESGKIVKNVLRTTLFCLAIWFVYTLVTQSYKSSWQRYTARHPQGVELAQVDCSEFNSANDYLRVWALAKGSGSLRNRCHEWEATMIAEAELFRASTIPEMQGYLAAISARAEAEGNGEAAECIVYVQNALASLNYTLRVGYGGHRYYSSLRPVPSYRTQLHTWLHGINSLMAGGGTCAETLPDLQPVHLQNPDLYNQAG